MIVTEKLAKRNADPFGANPVTIVCLGDSVTHGCFDCMLDRNGRVDTEYIASESYVRKLQDRLYRLYPVAATNVINAGISGDSSTGALARFERDVARYAPDVVTINLGLNDSMGTDAEKSLDAYIVSMKDLFLKTREIGAECILVTPNMMCTYVDSSLKDAVLREIAAAAAERQNDGTLARFVNVARETASSMGIPIADAYAAWEGYARSGVDTTQLLSNHINHPMPELHKVFADKIIDVFMK